MGETAKAALIVRRRFFEVSFIPLLPAIGVHGILKA